MPKTPEEDVREHIDGQLEACGWMVPDRDETDITSSLGVAIHESPLKSEHGAADYPLYADAKPIAVIEAKPEGTTLTVVETQSTKCAEGLVWASDVKASIREWKKDGRIRLEGLPPSDRVPEREKDHWLVAAR